MCASIYVVYGCTMYMCTMYVYYVLLELKCSGDTFTGVQRGANNDSSYSAPISPLPWCHGNNISATGAYQVLPQQSIRC